MLIARPDPPSGIREQFSPRTQSRKHGAGQRRTYLCHSDGTQSHDAKAERYLDISKAALQLKSIHFTYRTPGTSKKIESSASCPTRGSRQVLIEQRSAATWRVSFESCVSASATQHASRLSRSPCLNCILCQCLHDRLMTRTGRCVWNSETIT